MGKKLITGCLALFALAAFILPATASASPVLTHPTGTTLGTGKLLTGTNIGNTLLKSGTTVLSECTKAVITGELTKNNGEEIEGTITTATFTGTGASQFANMPECTGAILGNTTVTTNGGGVDENTVASGTPWCMKSTALSKFTVRGGKCSEAAREITFTMDSTAITGGPCHYKRAAAIEGTYTTDSTGDAIFTLTTAGTEFTKETGDPVLCPANGSLEMKFTMETDSSATEPVYIS